MVLHLFYSSFILEHIVLNCESYYSIYNLFSVIIHYFLLICCQQISKKPLIFYKGVLSIRPSFQLPACVHLHFQCNQTAAETKQVVSVIIIVKSKLCPFMSIQYICSVLKQVCTLHEQSHRLLDTAQHHLFIETALVSISNSGRTYVGQRYNNQQAQFGFEHNYL